MLIDHLPWLEYNRGNRLVSEAYCAVRLASQAQNLSPRISHGTRNISPLNLAVILGVAPSLLQTTPIERMILSLLCQLLCVVGWFN
jgi:hypothetical protein